MKRDVTEHALLVRAAKIMNLIEKQLKAAEEMFAEDEPVKESKNTPMPEREENKKKSSSQTAAPVLKTPVGLSDIDEVIRHASLIGAELGRSISRSEYEYIRCNWRSFFNAPRKFAATDTITLIEEELQAEKLLNKLC